MGVVFVELLTKEVVADDVKDNEQVQAKIPHKILFLCQVGFSLISPYCLSKNIDFVGSFP